MLQTVPSYAFAWPNKADWTVVLECTNGETGELIDFTDVEAVNIKVVDADNCVRLNATLGDGIEVVPSELGRLEFSFAATEMKTLCPATYKIGGVYQLDGEVNQLFVGTLAIIDGVAEI